MASSPSRWKARPSSEVSMEWRTAARLGVISGTRTIVDTNVARFARALAHTPIPTHAP
jgi:hypothetical protein